MRTHGAAAVAVPSCLWRRPPPAPWPARAAGATAALRASLLSLGCAVEQRPRTSGGRTLAATAAPPPRAAAQRLSRSAPRDPQAFEKLKESHCFDAARQRLLDHLRASPALAAALGRVVAGSDELKAAALDAQARTVIGAIYAEKRDRENRKMETVTARRLMEVIAAEACAAMASGPLSLIHI